MISKKNTRGTFASIFDVIIGTTKERMQMKIRRSNEEMIRLKKKHVCSQMCIVEMEVTTQIVYWKIYVVVYIMTPNWILLIFLWALIEMEVNTQCIGIQIERREI